MTHTQRAQLVSIATRIRDIEQDLYRLAEEADIEDLDVAGGDALALAETIYSILDEDHAS